MRELVNSFATPRSTWIDANKAGSSITCRSDDKSISEPWWRLRTARGAEALRSRSATLIPKLDISHLHTCRSSRMSVNTLRDAVYSSMPAARFEHMALLMA
jgi:hypothetical protein